MIEYGKVIKAEGDNALVSFKRHGECDRCKMCDMHSDPLGCALSVKNTVGAQQDDYVKVEVYKPSRRVGSVLIYLLPLCLVALGAGLGSLMSAGASAILAVCGLVVGLAFAVPIDVFILRKKKGFSSSIISTCTEDEYTQNAGKTHKKQ